MWMRERERERGSGGEGRERTDAGRQAGRQSGTGTVGVGGGWMVGRFDVPSSLHPTVYTRCAQLHSRRHRARPSSLRQPPPQPPCWVPVRQPKQPSACPFRATRTSIHVLESCTFLQPYVLGLEWKLVSHTQHKSRSSSSRSSSSSKTPGSHVTDQSVSQW